MSGVAQRSSREIYPSYGDHISETNGKAFLEKRPSTRHMSMQETHPSSDRLLDENYEGSLDRLDHHESHSSYQDRMDRYPTAQSMATIFQGARGVNIGGQPQFVNIGTMNHPHNPEASQQGFGNFKEFVSFDALHDSSVQDLDRHVDQVIREKTMGRFQEWIDHPDPAATESIVWLHGPAGIGKTAITLEVARTWQKKVVATFFFHRPDASRNDGNRLFITLAWQLAVSIQDIKNHIIRSLNERPDLPKKGVEAQFEYFVARPFEAVMETMSTIQACSLVVIIDGIDECTEVRLQRRILKVIRDAIRDRRVPLRFIISSKSEAHIQETFDQFECPILCIDMAKFSPLMEEIRKREEELKQWEQELKRHEAETRAEQEKSMRETRMKLEEEEHTLIERMDEIRKKGAKIRKREEEARQKQEETRRKALDGGRKEDKARKRAEETKMEEAIQREGGQTPQLEMEMRQKAENIKKREEEPTEGEKELEQRSSNILPERARAEERQREQGKQWYTQFRFLLLALPFLVLAMEGYARVRYRSINHGGIEETGRSTVTIHHGGTSTTTMMMTTFEQEPTATVTSTAMVTSISISTATSISVSTLTVTMTVFEDPT